MMQYITFDNETWLKEDSLFIERILHALNPFMLDNSDFRYLFVLSHKHS